MSQLISSARPASRVLCAVAATFCLAVSALTAPAFAQTRDCMRTINAETVCPPARSQCIQERDNLGIKCSPPDGGIAADFYGKAVCGPGSCVRTVTSETFCSKVPGGAAALSIHGEAVCTGGCEPAKASACVTPTK